MNIEEAIKELTDDTLHPTADFMPKLKDAIKLGIEALKAYLKSQEAGWYPPGYKLLGETKE